MSEASKLGILGEELAAKYLIKSNYKILHRNWGLHKGYEIDIIATNGIEIIFIEVKTRRDDTFQKPEEAVNEEKIKHICMAAHGYIRKYNIDMHYRFDIIAIVYTNSESYKIKHIKNAFKYPVYTNNTRYKKWF
jgi:putative endonuclease